MFANNFIKLLILILYGYFYTLKVNAEPFVILEYSNNKSSSSMDQENADFSNNEDFSTQHRIAKNETLSKIIEKYYGNGNLNLKFVQSAIIHKNRNVFVRSNPNFMFAGKKLYLPSINEIKNLVYNKHKNVDKISTSSKKSDIYFFGN